MFPRSLLLIPAAFAGYALLAFPGIGFLLAIFGGLYLPPLLLNLAVVGTAVEAWIGSSSRTWLLLAVLWFGGSAVLAGVDRLQIHQARTQADPHWKFPELQGLRSVRY